MEILFQISKGILVLHIPSQVSDQIDVGNEIEIDGNCGSAELNRQKNLGQYVDVEYVRSLEQKVLRFKQVRKSFCFCSNCLPRNDIYNLSLKNIAFKSALEEKMMPKL